VFLTVLRNRFLSFNAKFVTADVVIHKLKVECLPVLFIIWLKKACPLSATCNKYLDFIIFRTLAKMFDTFSQVIFNKCRTVFNIQLVADMIGKHNINFLVRYCASDKFVLCLHQVQNAKYKSIAPELKL